MASFDISRVTTDLGKPYSSVRMQQGRVLLDDDWNENERIDAEEKRRTRRDIIGSFGIPNDGYNILNPLNNPNNLIEFAIKEGTMHLGGIRFDLENPETFLSQKTSVIQQVKQRPENTRVDLIYVEAWQQPVSAVEDGTLLEPALGAHDTTTRIANIAVVKLHEGIGATNCAEAWNRFIDYTKKHPVGWGTIRHHVLDTDTFMKVTFTNQPAAQDLCSPAQVGGYLGADNQAIRVQLTKTKNCFTWGFDNAAPHYRVTLAADVVTMVNLPNDQYHWPAVGQVVELLPWSVDLLNGDYIADTSGHLTTVKSAYNPVTKSFTINAVPNPPLPGQFYYLRVWNRGNDMSPPEIQFNLNQPMPLGNTGLAVTFTGTDFHPTDHWVIAARPNTPNAVMPAALMRNQGMKPMGSKRYFAPLALIQWSRDAQGQIQGKVIHDCRKLFRALTADECCCTYSVGDGRISWGDFNSIQEAIDNLPPTGGKICVLRGVHRANAKISNRRDIRIVGCNEQTIVHPKLGQAMLSTPIFDISSSTNIHISNMTILSLDGIGVRVQDPIKGVSSNRITIDNTVITAFKHAIRVKVNETKADQNEIYITNNRLHMIDRPGGDVAIYCLADDVLIRENRIVVIPDHEVPRPPDDDDPDPNDGCFTPVKFYQKYYNLVSRISKLALRISKAFSFVKKQVYKTKGGIQIGGGSERVQIVGNHIVGGASNGITLGDAPLLSGKRVRPSFLYDIRILQNRIMLMGWSGIGVKTVAADDEEFQVSVEDLLIDQNQIRLCAHDPRQSKYIMSGGISLGVVDRCSITSNEIADNGNDYPEGTCGLFIYYGDRIDISGNHIYNNGSDSIKGNAPYCGGIVVSMSFQALAKMLLKVFGSRDQKLPAVFDADPVVKIQSNIVTQPVGHSVFVTAVGPVMVSGNQLASQGLTTANKFSRIGANVFILNIGFSPDLILRRDHIKGSDLQQLPQGKTMFNDNQTVLDLKGEEKVVGISAETVVSFDDVSYHNNQCDCRSVPDGNQAWLMTNAFVLGLSSRIGDNRFTDSAQLPIFSLYAAALRWLLIGNQATHCMMVNGNTIVDNVNQVFDNTYCKDDNFNLVAGGGNIIQ